MTILRKGKTKTILESSIDSALLAVEIYNKPRATFRSEGFITLMIIAWTRLFHAYFNNTIGDKYHYKMPNGRYDIVDGDKKAWEITKCIKEYSQINDIPDAVRVNLEFFIRLRNKIEHRHITKREVDVLIFGECQAFLYNYETFLIQTFGIEYAINESLVYSLQFSQLRTNGQKDANKSILSRDLADIVSYIETYRSLLSDDIFNSQEYSIKLIQIPKISNTSKADAAIEFVKLSELSDADKLLYEQISVIIKDKKVKVEGINIGKLKPSEVVEKVNQKLNNTLKMHLHTCLHKVFSIRPSSGAVDPFDTNPEYCHYDEAHNDYVYQEAWVDFIVHIIQSGRLSFEQIRDMAKRQEKLDISVFEV